MSEHAANHLEAVYNVEHTSALAMCALREYQVEPSLRLLREQHGFGIDQAVLSYTAPILGLIAVELGDENPRPLTVVKNRITAALLPAIRRTGKN